MHLALMLVATLVALAGLTLGAIKASRWVEFGFFLGAAAALGASFYTWRRLRTQSTKGGGAGTVFAAIAVVLAIGVAVVRPRPAPPPAAPSAANVTDTTIQLSRHDRQVIQNFVQKFDKAGDKKTAGFLGGLGVGAVTAGTLIKAIGTLTSKGKLGLEAAKALLGILEGGVSVSVSRTLNIEQPTLSLGGLYIGSRIPPPSPSGGSTIIFRQPLFSLGTLRLQAPARLVVKRVKETDNAEDPPKPDRELPRTP
jgi:hypothetical protein